MIPTLGGPSLPLLSYRGAFNFIRESNEILQEGYRKASLPCSLPWNLTTRVNLPLQYYNSAFKVAMLDQWFVIVNGVSMVEDIRLKPENELSTREGAGEARLSCCRPSYMAQPLKRSIYSSSALRTLWGRTTTMIRTTQFSSKTD